MPPIPDLTTPISTTSSLDLSRLSSEELDEFDELARNQLEAESLEAFIARVAPRQPPPPHLRRLIEKIEGARRREIRLCVSMPPRHGKSITLHRAFCWWLTHSPRDTCAYTTYNSEFALSQSRKIQAIARAAGVPFAGGMAEWRTPQGGGLLAAGVEAGLTGQGVQGLLVVDDPFKNRIEANSRLNRNNVWEWFSEVVETRPEGASIIVCHTRWHEDDLIGRLAGDKDFEVINFPAVAEEKDPLGREPGEALWPGRFPLAKLEKRRARNAFSFAALYQGRPRPRGGTVFSKEPPRFDLGTFDPTGFRIYLAGDPAATDDTSGDFSALVALAVKGEEESMVGYVIDFYRQQVQVPDFVDQVIRFQERHGGGSVGIEAVGGFKAVPQMLRKVKPGIRIQEIRPIGDKYTRSHPVATAWNNGRVFVPARAAWVEALLEEVMAFTGVNDATDDQVDALSHVWAMAQAAPVPVYTSPGAPILPRRRAGITG